MTRYRGVIFCIFVSLYVLCQFRVIDGATTTATTKAPLSKTTKKTNNTKTAHKLPARTGGQIITLKFGGNDGNVPIEQCECKQYYLCDAVNAVYSTQAEQKCNEDNVICCKVETETESPIIIPSPDPDPADCRCVPTEQCSSYAQDRTTIQRRTNECEATEYCCSEENIIPTRPTNPPPVVNPSTEQPVYECGLKNAGIDDFTRIASPNHLQNTTFGEFPWMALLLTAEIDSTTGQRVDNIYVCGASLISPTMVLTAAHCVYNLSDVSLLKVRLGEYNTRVPADQEQKAHQDRQVLRITQHPQFNSKTLHNNLALLEVGEAFVYDYHIRPICIPSTTSNDYDYDPANCVATGWGKNAFGSDAKYSTVLRQVNLPIVPHDQCQTELRQTRLGPYFILDPSFICAGGQVGTDTCEGDGGGPLVCLVRNTLNKYVQVGIVSWGIECANGLPGVYANLEKNADWLQQEVQVSTLYRSSGIGARGK